MIYTQDLPTRSLSPMETAELLLSCLAAEAGARVTVKVTVPKVTEATPRIGGKDYVETGLPSDLHIGPLEVHRYVDNRDNQKLNRVGAVYLKVRSVTRANGLREFGWVTMRPADITSFKRLGISTPDPELATKALAEAATQTPSGV
jgi:hypothetical protein